MASEATATPITTPKPIEAVAAGPVKEIKTEIVRKSSFLERLGAFSAGVVVATVVVGYYMGVDLKDSSIQVNQSLRTLENEITAQNEELRKRIERLESRS